MSLRFYFGPSGAGKSRLLYEEIIARSIENPRQNFLIIVPDQFTMQTQKELVTLHPRGGIMNIDVLSFGRLAHRIFEETGGQDTQVLDDTGKSLVLQKVAGALKEKLPTLGGNLHKQGYIHEVKSAISEFMQYGIGTEDVSRLIAFAEKRGALAHKLKDLETLYKGFMDYISGHYITTEETLGVLCSCLGKSALLPGSVVAFDGFTGFTPIQNQVIRQIMELAAETIVTVTLGSGENPYEPDGEQKLFHLSKKTVYALENLAKESRVEREADIFICPKGQGCLQRQDSGRMPENASVKMSGMTSGKEADGKRPGMKVQENLRHRFYGNPAMETLERSLFRYQYTPYTDEQDKIHIMEATTPREEVHQAGLQILELVRTGGLAYRDVAVITGDLPGYAPYVETEFAQMEIPCYIDQTRGIVLNPMIEYIKSALALFLKDFSYEAVFHYLRSGLADITPEEVDALENYCIQTGVRGQRKWSMRFTHKTAQMGEDEEPLEALNRTREQLMQQLSCLSGRSRGRVSEYVNQLYDFLTQNRVQEKLQQYEEEFTRKNDPSRAREYAQIYRLVIDLLDQIYELLGEETITLQEFSDILEAGFGEIEVGTIPQNVDRILVGDMERTRLKQVKVLFFLGVNDGNIPKSTTKGGIISDIDREFLQESELELAPSPRQQMYIQRLYLYLNMTKPSDALYLSYSKVNSAGKSIRPAYLIDVVEKLFPGIRVEYPQNRSVLEQVVTPQEGLRFLAQELRGYVEGGKEQNGRQEFMTLYQAYGENEQTREKRKQLTEAAFRRYQASALPKAIARALYGVRLENSVSRLETYAACAYRHFLQYGLTLQERQEFGFENVDMGNVFHGVLEQFSKSLEESGYTWFDFPKSFGERTVSEALETYAAQYGDTILYSTARNEYAITRMGRVLTRTVLTLQNQLQKGEFQPDGYELSFRYTDNLDAVNISLSEEEKMRLRGRIDRIDIAEDEEKVYVKVIDYKSGSRQFDIAALYYGLQLQLVVYMNAAMELEARKHPRKEIVPAALLYYHIEDPTVETPVELDEEALNQQILAKLRMNGVVNSQEDIVSRLDRYMAAKSDVIPVEKKKDGTFSARSSIMSSEELKVISNYVNHKVRSIGREILDGKIGVNPYEKGSADACTYCVYRKVCGFDAAIPGYGKRNLEELEHGEALERMKKDITEGEV